MYLLNKFVVKQIILDNLKFILNWEKFMADGIYFYTLLAFINFFSSYVFPIAAPNGGFLCYESVIRDLDLASVCGRGVCV